MSLPNTFFLGKRGYVGVYPLTRIYTSGGSFTAPFEGTFLISLAGGGGGSSGSTYGYYSGESQGYPYEGFYGYGGGGGAAAGVDIPVPLLKGQKLSFTVGAAANDSSDGGATTIDGYFRANGGAGSYNRSGGSGGTFISTLGNIPFDSSKMFNGGSGGSGGHFESWQYGPLWHNNGSAGVSVNGNSGPPPPGTGNRPGGGGGSAIAGYGSGSNYAISAQPGVVIIRYVV